MVPTALAYLRNRNQSIVYETYNHITHPLPLKGCVLVHEHPLLKEVWQQLENTWFSFSSMHCFISLWVGEQSGPRLKPEKRRGENAQNKDGNVQPHLEPSVGVNSMCGNTMLRIVAYLRHVMTVTTMPCSREHLCTVRQCTGTSMGK